MHNLSGTIIMFVLNSVNFFCLSRHIMQQAPSGAVPTVHQTISPTFQEAQVATQPEAVVTMATTQVIAGNGEIQFTNAQALAQFEADKRAVYRLKI